MNLILFSKERSYLDFDLTFFRHRFRNIFDAYVTRPIKPCSSHRIYDGMGNPVTLRYPRGPDSSMVEHLVQFQKGLGSSPGPVTFHAAII